MGKVLITEQYLQDIADAIRRKNSSIEIYTPGEMAGAIMEIETGIIPTGTKQIAANGTHDVTQYASANVQVPNTYVAADEGKVVSNGALVAQTGTTITQNGTYDTTENDEVTVTVSGGGAVLQSKTAVRNGTITPDVGYDGLSRVVVNVPNTGPIAPIIRCGMAKGSMTQALDLSLVNAEKLIVVAMNGDTDNKTLGTHVETLSSALTGTTLDYHQYSATGDNRMNYRIDAYDLSADVSGLEISLTDGWMDEHTAFAWALIGTSDFVIGKVMTTLEAVTTGSNDRSGSVLFGTMNGSGAGSSGGAAYSDSYHRGDTVATDDPGSGYMGSYIIWFAESGGGNTLTGTTPPDSALGTDGDFYIQTASDGVLTSDGACYINTNIKPNALYAVEIVAAMTQQTTNYDTLFGTRNGSAGRFTARFYYEKNGALEVHKSSYPSGNYTAWSTGETKSTMLDTYARLYIKDILRVNGVFKNGTTTSSVNAFPYSLFLFANNNAGSVSDYGCCAIKRFKVWNNNDELIMYLVPSLYNGEACMYDLVTGQYFRNSGTGTFTYTNLDTSFDAILWKKISGAWMVILEWG